MIGAAGPNTRQSIHHAPPNLWEKPRKPRIRNGRAAGYLVRHLSHGSLANGRLVSSSITRAAKPFPLGARSFREARRTTEAPGCTATTAVICPISSFIRRRPVSGSALRICVSVASHEPTTAPHHRPMPPPHRGATSRAIPTPPSRPLQADHACPAHVTRTRVR